jgi:hypothetical protein
MSEFIDSLPAGTHLLNIRGVEQVPEEREKRIGKVPTSTD